MAAPQSSERDELIAACERLAEEIPEQKDLWHRYCDFWIDALREAWERFAIARGISLEKNGLFGPPIQIEWHPSYRKSPMAIGYFEKLPEAWIKIITPRVTPMTPTTFVRVSQLHCPAPLTAQAVSALHAWVRALRAGDSWAERLLSEKAVALQNVPPVVVGDGPNLEERLLQWQGKRTKLQPQDAKLLRVLWPDKVVREDDACSAAWGANERANVDSTKGRINKALRNVGCPRRLSRDGANLKMVDKDRSEIERDSERV